MKKILAAILSFSMLCGVMPYSVAMAEVDYTDYVASEEMPENIIPVDSNNSPARTFVNAAIRNSTAVQGSKGTTWGEGKCFTPLILTAESEIGESTSNGFLGFVLKNSVTFDVNKSYVFSAGIRKTAGDSARIGLAISNEEPIPGTLSFSKEYGREGMEITDEYSDFKVTIKPGEEFDSSATNSLVLGYPKGIEAGTVIEIDTSQPQSIYLSEEQAFDITNTVITNPDDIMQGSRVELQADIVNQLGLSGYLTQEFDWAVLDEDKIDLVEGFNITEIDVNKVQIDISEEVPVGRYAVVAISEEYDGFIRTAYIDVQRKRIQDSDMEETDKPENIILQPTNSGFAERTDTSAISASASENVYTVTANQKINNEIMQMDGLKIRTVFNRGFANGFVFNPGGAYVISAEVKKAESSTVDEVYFNVGFSQGESDTFSVTKEYGTQGMLLSDDWQEFKATIKISDDYDTSVTDKLFYLGMPNGTEAGAAFDMKLSVYLAEELASYASIESDTQIIGLENTATVIASINNQLGLPGYLNQEFDWYVLDEKRMTEEDDILVDSTDGTAVLSVDEFAENGIYYIVAEKINADEVIRKSLQITVDKPTAQECMIEFINDATADELAEKLPMYAEKLEIDFALANEDAAKLIINAVSEEKLDASDTETLVKLIKKAIAVSLYNENEKDINLYSSDGKFTFAEEIAMEDIDTDGVTVNELFEESLSDKGRIKVQKALEKGTYSSFEEFEKEFALQTILNTIAYPSVSGTGYVAEVLTKENTELAGIDAEYYLSLSNKSSLNKKVARNEYTKKELETALKKTTQGGTQNGGGGTSSRPSSGNVSVNISNETNNINKTDKKTPVQMFDDVKETHWAYADIYHLKERGMISGVDENNFAPDGTVTREQFVKMFCEAMGYEAMGTGTVYSDVVSGSWYEQYISTAVSQKLVNGISETVFGIGMPIKRQDLCVIVYRAIGSEETDGEMEFTDSADINDYAKNAVAYMSEFGIISGFDDGSFKPNENCTRAQAAKILCKILNMKGLIE